MLKFEYDMAEYERKLMIEIINYTMRPMGAFSL